MAKKAEQSAISLLLGHQPSKDSSIIKTCMSQWWPWEFTENRVTYKNAEHYMVAKKAMLFADQDIFEKVLTKNSPRDTETKQFWQSDSVPGLYPGEKGRNNN